MVTEQGISAYEVARRLSISRPAITCWIRKYKKGKLSLVGNTMKPLSEIEMESARAKRKLARVKMERDFLKKATVYFAKESLSGTR